MRYFDSLRIRTVEGRQGREREERGRQGGKQRERGRREETEMMGRERKPGRMGGRYASQKCGRNRERIGVKVGEKQQEKTERDKMRRKGGTVDEGREKGNK